MDKAVTVSLLNWNPIDQLVPIKANLLVNQTFCLVFLISFEAAILQTLRYNIVTRRSKGGKLSRIGVSSQRHQVNRGRIVQTFNPCSLSGGRIRVHGVRSVKSGLNNMSQWTRQGDDQTSCLIKIYLPVIEEIKA